MLKMTAQSRCCRSPGDRTHSLTGRDAFYATVRELILPSPRVSHQVLHYASTPMQYTAIFNRCNNVNFQMKKYNIFLIFAQNIDCGYTLELPH